MPDVVSGNTIVWIFVAIAAFAPIALWFLRSRANPNAAPPQEKNPIDIES